MKNLTAFWHLNQRPSAVFFFFFFPNNELALFHNRILLISIFFSFSICILNNYFFMRMKLCVRMYPNSVESLLNTGSFYKLMIQLSLQDYTTFMPFAFYLMTYTSPTICITMITCHLVILLGIILFFN